MLGPHFCHVERQCGPMNLNKDAPPAFIASEGVCRFGSKDRARQLNELREKSADGCSREDLPASAQAQ